MASQTTATPVLQADKLQIKYHTRDGILTAVRNVNFHINPGEIVGIVGESGCGKSTVAASILRLLPPNGEISGGRILFRGRDLARLDEEELRQLRGNHIAMVFQDPMTSLNPVFDIETQVLDRLMAHRTGQDRRELRGRAIKMLERVGIPDAARSLKRFPHQFSGGMRQRIMVAMALMTNPALLIADEPTSALDVTLEAQIVDLIRGLRDEFGTSILYITHDLGVVAQLCDRVVVMYAGNIVETGDACDIFESPKHPYTRALLASHPSRGQRLPRLVTIPGRVPSLRDLPPGCKFAPRCAQATENCHSREPGYLTIGTQCILCHTYDGDAQVSPDHDILPRPEQWDDFGGLRGKEGPEIGVASDGHPYGPSVVALSRVEKDNLLVQTRNLSIHFHDRPGLLDQFAGAKPASVRAVDGVDLYIRRGEILALVGESGSGKTTLGRTILRLQDATGGEITVNGQDITRLEQDKLRPLRARMQMIFQDPYASLSPRMKVSSILVEPFRIHGVPVDPRRKVAELLEMVGLAAEQADKYPHQLSGGQARRVGIARALALEPDLLVADEPTAGLDVSVAAGVLNLLKDLRERLNLTYLLITHNLNIINFIADRVAVMYLGKVAEIGPADEIFTTPRHPYTEALMSAIALPDPRLRDWDRRIILEGEIPSPRNPPPGCTFHPRCRYAQPACSQQAPALRGIAGPEHFSACHFAEQVGSL